MNTASGTQVDPVNDLQDRLSARGKEFDRLWFERPGTVVLVDEILKLSSQLMRDEIDKRKQEERSRLSTARKRILDNKNFTLVIKALANQSDAEGHAFNILNLLAVEDCCVDSVKKITPRAAKNSEVLSHKILEETQKKLEQARKLINSGMHADIDRKISRVKDDHPARLKRACIAHAFFPEYLLPHAAKRGKSSRTSALIKAININLPETWPGDLPTKKETVIKNLLYVVGVSVSQGTVINTLKFKNRQVTNT